MTRRLIPLAVTAAALAVGAAPAAAHVTVQPNTATPGSYTVLNVRVPNEQDKANTTRIDLQLPPGFATASYQQVPGWTVKVKTEKLAQPIQTDDGPVSEGVSEITWTGNGKQGKIPPGAFQDFPISVLVPGKEGQTLTFKAIQRYDNGDVVRWIGAPNADEPAPQVKLVEADDDADDHHMGGSDKASATDGASGGTAHASDDDDDGTDGLAVAALIVGAIGVVLGAGGLAVGRRNAAT